MIRLIVIVSLTVLMAPVGSAAADIYGLIRDGKLQEARDSLSLRATAASRDGDYLFCQSLLESNAAQASRLMEAALNTSVSARFQEEIHYRLAQYYLIAGDRANLARLLTDYQSRWPQGKYESEMMRLSVLLDEMAKDFEAALKQCDRYLITYKSSPFEQWGQIDKARVLAANKKNIGSLRTLRQLSRAKSGGTIPLALYLLGTDAARRNRTDDAVFYYSIFREGYPAAIGLDDLVERLGGMSSETGASNEAEKLTGTFYSVKIGVFSEKGNAKRQRDLFKDYGHKIDIQSKTISGKKYHVVYVGRFQNYQKALAVQSQLEAAHNEPFQVVAR
ncbi:MAG: SPOR domain-containing protein [bacterium]|nr:SPOR domain-containing protein [bacterium]